MKSDTHRERREIRHTQRDKGKTGTNRNTDTSRNGVNLVKKKEKNIWNRNENVSVIHTKLELS